VPGAADGNWRWRCTRDTLSPAVFASLRDLTVTSSRDARRSPQRPFVAGVAS